MADAFRLAEERATQPGPAYDYKWGTPFGNREGKLPPGLGPYREYSAYDGATRVGTLGLYPRGGWRIVIGKNGEVFNTWTHYGTATPLPGRGPRVPFLRSR